MRRLIWLTAAGLAGCVQPDVYAQNYHVDYRAQLTETVAASVQKTHPHVPWTVVSAYAECSADFTVAHLTVEDKAKLDAWARANQPLTPSELRDIDRRINAAAGGDITHDRLDVLSGTCPDKVPEFKKYL